MSLEISLVSFRVSLCGRRLAGGPVLLMKHHSCSIQTFNTHFISWNLRFFTGGLSALLPSLLACLPIVPCSWICLAITQWCFLNLDPRIPAFSSDPGNQIDCRRVTILLNIQFTTKSHLCSPPTDNLSYLNKYIIYFHLCQKFLVEAKSNPEKLYCTHYSIFQTNNTWHLQARKWLLATTL